MYRIGQSTDIHRFKEGDHLVLGGVSIPFEKGIDAHSDGDALCHAIAESMLGALALGDLGHHFPDTDPRYENISSLLILEQVYVLVQAQGYAINNLDALILIERPKMAPYIEKMRSNIASILHTDIANVSIKATRGEKMGFIGQSEGIMAQCVVLLKNE